MAVDIDALRIGKINSSAGRFASEDIAYDGTAQAAVNGIVDTAYDDIPYDTPYNYDTGHGTPHDNKTHDTARDTAHDMALWSQLVAVHARVGGSVERTLQRRFGIGTTELQALIALAQSPDGELRMQELNDVTFLNQSSVSRLVARLERAGLAERRSCEQDRRGVFTGITDSGARVLRSALPVYEGSLRESFDQLAVDPKLRSLVHRLRHAEAR
jgi:DNA-binding MarR family transcriptional regulator